MNAPQDVKVEKILTVRNKLGLHARPAALFVQAVGKYKCKVQVAKGEVEVNGKSLMGLMMLAAEQGSQVRIRLTGNDAPAAMVDLENLFARNFDE